MNPNPFWALKNFTVPVAIMALLALLRLLTRRARTARWTKHPSFGGMTWCSAQNRERSKAGRKPRLRGRLYTNADVPSNRENAVRPRVRAGFAWRRARAAR